MVLCGAHPATGEPSYVVVELKQWSRALMLDGSDEVCVLEGVGERLHPVEQVRRYCTHLADFVAVLEEAPQHLTGLAYLHNATDLDVDGLWELEQSDWGQLFTGQRRGELRRLLRAKLAPAPGVEAADSLLGSVVRPSKQLLTLAADEVQRREQFVLLDEQRTAYSLVMRAVERGRTANAKEVLIVTGGPGSGKSVIALSLLGELSRRGRSVLHATGSSAFTPRPVSDWTPGSSSSTGSSAAEEAERTSTGCYDYSVSRVTGLSHGKATRTSICSSAMDRARWRRICAPSSNAGMERVWRRAIAGGGVTRFRKGS